MVEAFEVDGELDLFAVDGLHLDGAHELLAIEGGLLSSLFLDGRSLGLRILGGGDLSGLAIERRELDGVHLGSFCAKAHVLRCVDLDLGVE
tara:strand:+ start:305 stop:577 length:273 start_codon:yes stop_codon:yes gene_type:complete